MHVDTEPSTEVVDVPVHVGLFAVGLLRQDLGSHVKGTANGALLLCLLDARKTEIGHLGHPVLVHQDVLCLQVEMPIPKG
jgi:hypothetical protein